MQQINEYYNSPNRKWCFQLNISRHRRNVSIIIQSQINSDSVERLNGLWWFHLDLLARWGSFLLLFLCAYRIHLPLRSLQQLEVSDCLKTKSTSSPVVPVVFCHPHLPRCQAWHPPRQPGPGACLRIVAMYLVMWTRGAGVLGEGLCHLLEEYLKDVPVNLAPSDIPWQWAQHT